MIEWFGVFAIGILFGILGTILIFSYINKKTINTMTMNIDGNYLEDEGHFEDLEEEIFVDENLENIPEDSEIVLPEYTNFRIPTGEDLIKHEENMKGLIINGNENE